MFQVDRLIRTIAIGMLVALPSLFAGGCGWTTTDSTSVSETDDSANAAELPPEALTGTPEEIAAKLLDNWSQDAPTVKLRRVVSTRPLASYVRDASFSPDGKRIVARLRDSEIVVIDAKSGKTVWSKKIDLEDTNAGALLAISRDGRFVAINLHGRKVEVWDTQSGQLVVERAERNPIHFVGLSHTGDSFFICEVAPPPGNSGSPNYNPSATIELAPPVEISFADGEATTIQAEGFDAGVVAMSPIMGGKGYLVLDSNSELRYWNPEEPGASKQLTRKTVFAKAGQCWVRANRHVFMAHVAGTVRVGAMASLGLDPEPLQSGGTAPDDDSESTSDDEEASLPTLVDLGQLLNDTPSQSNRIWGRVDMETGRCFTSTKELSACDPDFPSFVVTVKGDDDRFRRSLDLSPDCKYIVAADKDLAKSTLTIYELVKVPEHPAMRVHKWARKALTEQNHELIDAVIAAAGERTDRPQWSYGLVNLDQKETAIQQVVEGMLESRWASSRVAKEMDAVNRWKVTHPSVVRVNPDALAQQAIGLSQQNISFRDNAPAKQLIDFILNDPRADSQAVKAFIEMAPSVSTGRKILIDVAARAAEVCDPRDEVLVEIANGLHEYAFEAPEDPVIESTVGLIEAVANAEARRKGTVAGDTAYATLTLAVSNASSFKYMTGRERFPKVDSSSRFRDLQIERHKLARQYVDCERLVRGLTTHLSAHPGDKHAAKLALELGYETNDKNLAKLAIPFFEKSPQMLQPPPYGYGNIQPYLEWAKSP